MKFFNFIPLSSCPLGCSVCRDDAPNTLGPSRQLYSQCSIPRIQLPRNAAPNISSPGRETLAVATLTYALSTSLPAYACSGMGNTLYAYAHDPCSRHLSISSHSQYYISEQSGLDIEPVYHLSEHGNDTWLPIQYGLSFDLLNENFFYRIPFSKSMTFIETESFCNEIAGF